MVTRAHCRRESCVRRKPGNSAIAKPTDAGYAQLRVGWQANDHKVYVTRLDSNLGDRDGGRLDSTWWTRSTFSQVCGW